MKHYREIANIHWKHVLTDLWRNVFQDQTSFKLNRTSSEMLDTCTKQVSAENVQCVKTILWKNFKVIQLAFSCVLIYLFWTIVKCCTTMEWRKKWSIKYTCCLSCCRGYRLSTIKFDINVLLSADINNVTENTIQPGNGTIPRSLPILRFFSLLFLFWTWE